MVRCTVAEVHLQMCPVVGCGASAGRQPRFFNCDWYNASTLASKSLAETGVLGRLLEALPSKEGNIVVWFQVVDAFIVGQIASQQ